MGWLIDFRSCDILCVLYWFSVGFNG